MRNKRIGRMILQHHTTKTIIEECHLSKRDLYKIKQQLVEKGVTLADWNQMSDDEVEAFYNECFPKEPICVEIDFQYYWKLTACEELTIRAAWNDYCDKHISERCYSYHSFRTKLGRYSSELKISDGSICPGELLLVDWLPGKNEKNYILTLVFPYSGMSYIGKTSKRNTTAIIDLMSKCFKLCGGIPKRICFLCNEGIYKDRNKLYQGIRQYFEYLKITIDNRLIVDPVVLEEVRKIENDIQANIPLCNQWKSNVLTASSSATIIRFEEGEQRTLTEKDSYDFDLIEQRECYPGKDCHLAIGNMHYSVPWNHQGPYQVYVFKDRVEIVGVELTETKTFVTSFTNKEKQETFVTNPNHLPDEETRKRLPWNKERYINQARSIGECTAKAVQTIFDAVKFEEQAYLECEKVLNLGRSKGKKALETACSEVISNDLVVNYSTINKMI